MQAPHMMRGFLHQKAFAAEKRERREVSQRQMVWQFYTTPNIKLQPFSCTHSKLKQPSCVYMY